MADARSIVLLVVLGVIVLACVSITGGPLWGSIIGYRLKKYLRDCGIPVHRVLYHGNGWSVFVRVNGKSHRGCTVYWLTVAGYVTTSIIQGNVTELYIIERKQK